MLLLAFLMIAGCEKGEETSEVSLNYMVMQPLDGRPTILVIGDSISLGYTPTISKRFPDHQVIHNTGNAAHTRVGIANIRAWVEHAPEWEVCAINHGLHDIHELNNIPVEEYVDNLEIEVDVLRERCREIIFSTTTQVPVGARSRDNAKAIEYNEAAVDLMTSLNIPVCDLYSKSLTIKHLQTFPNNVHYKPTGYQILGNELARCIRSM